MINNDKLTSAINVKLPKLWDEALNRIRHSPEAQIGDRIRIIFEFEIQGAGFHQVDDIDERFHLADAIEIRHRRPWK